MSKSDFLFFENIGFYKDVFWKGLVFMNIIISFFMGLGIVFCVINPSSPEIFTVISESLVNCGSLVFSLFFITAFYSGIMQTLQDSGITKKAGKGIDKITRKIFQTKNEKALEKATLNISANILGIGNAATPMGLMAMKEFSKEATDDFPTYDMCKFMLFNTCSVQLVPTTIITLRATAGSKEPSLIILPVIIVSFSTLVFGLFVLKIVYKIFGEKKIK